MRIETFTTRIPRFINGGCTNRYYFRLVADNNEIIAQSEAYTSKAARDKTAKLIKREAGDALIVDVTP